jgi:hypothetical protein
MFTFTPKSEKELQSMNLIDVGQYPFEVLAAHDKDEKGQPLISKKGNSMIKLKLKVWDINGNERVIYDYLVAMDNMIYKIKHFCDSVGLTVQYEQGRFSAHDCLGKSGTLDIVIQKDKTGQYADKNAVKDYVVTVNSKTAQVNNEVPFDDDDVPF